MSEDNSLINNKQEPFDKNFNNKLKATHQSRRWKWISVIVFLIVLASCFNLFLSNFIKFSVEKLSEQNYELSFKTAYLNPFTQKLSFENAIIKSTIENDTSQALQSVSVDELYLQGFGLYSFLIKKEINFSKLKINGITAYLNENQVFKKQHEKVDTITISNINRITHNISNQLRTFFHNKNKSFGLEDFEIKNASIFFHNAKDSLKNFSVLDFSVSADLIFLNENIVQHIDSLMFFNNFEFSFGKNNWSPIIYEQNYNIGFDTIFYSSKSKRFIVKNLTLIDEKNPEILDVSTPVISLENIDLKKIINENSTHSDTLKFQDAKAKITIIEKEKQHSSDTSLFEKNLQKIHPIYLKNILLENNQIEITYIPYKKAAINFKSIITVYLSDFELNKETYKETKNNLFSKDYSIHLMDLNSSKKGDYNVSLKDLFWHKNDKNLFVQNIKYEDISYLGNQTIVLQEFHIKNFELDDLISDRNFQATAIEFYNGTISLKHHQNAKPPMDKELFTMMIPNNNFVNSVKIDFINLENINFIELQSKIDTAISVSNIALNIYELNMIKGKKYSLLETDFCQKIAIKTGKTHFFDNKDFYKISWSQIHKDIKNQIQWNDFTITTTVSMEQLIQERVILPPQIIQAHCSSLEFTKFDLPLLFKDGIVKIDSFYAFEPNIYIYKTEFEHRKDNNFEISQIAIDKLELENGIFAFENDSVYFDINDYYFRIDSLNINNIQNEEPEFNFKDITFEYETQTYKQRTTYIKTEQLKANFLNEKFSLDACLLNIQNEQKPFNNLKFKIQDVSFSQLDYRALFFDKVLYAESFKASSATFDGNLNLTIQNIDTIHKELPFKQILIRTVKIPNIKSDFVVKDEKETYYFAFNKSYFNANNVNWAPTMSGFPHRGKLKFGIKNIKGEIINAKKEVLIDSVIFSTIPNVTTIYNGLYRDLLQEPVLKSVGFHEFTISQLNLDSLYTSNRFISEHLMVNGGDVVFDLDVLSNKNNKEKKSNQQEKKKLDRTLIYDLFKQITFNDIQLKIIQDKKEQLVHLNKGKFDQESGGNITIDALSFVTNNEMVNLGFKNLHISTKQRQMQLDSCYYTPIIAKEEWGNYFGYQNDWTKFSIKSIVLEDVDLEELIAQETLIFPLVKVNQMMLEDYRDKNLPFPKNFFPGMFPDKLKKIFRPFKIDTLLVFSSEFIYEELVPYALFPGRVYFTNAEMKATNVTNAPEFINNPMLIDVSMMLMDTSKVTSFLTIALDDSLNYFDVSAKLTPFDMTLLNPVLENLAFLTIKEGYCNGLTMNFHGDKRYALGGMQFKYQNFKIGLIDKKKLHPSLGTNVLAFFANTFIVKHSNPTDLFPRQGIMYFEPDLHKSFFNYLFKTSLSGIKNTIGLKEQKAKDKNSEIYNTYEQERKELKKSYKAQKKEEKKLLKKSKRKKN